MNGRNFIYLTVQKLGSISDCTCYQPKEIRLCPITTCALWPYRMGKRPKPSEGTANALKRELVGVVG